MKSTEYDVMRSVEDRHWWYCGLRSMLEMSFPILVVDKTHVIFDIGCGTGANLRAMRRLVPDAVFFGVDRAPQAFERTVPASNVHFCRGDVNLLPLADESADIVFAGDLLGQRGVSLPAAVRHFSRVLKPGGVLMLNVPAFAWLRGRHDIAAHVDKRFDRPELKKSLHDAGFESVNIRFWNNLLVVPMLVYRIISRIDQSASDEATSDLTLRSGFLNAILSFWIRFETKLSMLAILPFGSSIFATARKPATSLSQFHG